MISSSELQIMILNCTLERPETADEKHAFGRVIAGSPQPLLHRSDAIRARQLRLPRPTLNLKAEATLSQNRSEVTCSAMRQREFTRRGSELAPTQYFQHDKLQAMFIKRISTKLDCMANAGNVNHTVETVTPVLQGNHAAKETKVKHGLCPGMTVKKRVSARPFKSSVFYLLH